MRGRKYTVCLWSVFIFSVINLRTYINIEPLVVSRPLFIEEHGLRLLLDRDGAGVELSREGYESGEWAEAVQQAYIKGLPLKLSKRKRGEEDLKMRKLEGRNMAMQVVSWVKDVWA